MITIGPIVGYTEPTESRIWIRSDTAETVTLDPVEATHAVKRVDLGRNVHRFELSGLTPGRTYQATVVDAKGSRLGAATVRTTTSSPSQVRLWFGSCYNRVSGDAIWDVMFKRMLAAPPDQLCLIGDQVYADEQSEWPDKAMPFFTKTGEALEAAYESLYERTWTNSRVARVLASVPTVMTWDDHELFDDWGSDPRHRRTDKQGKLRFETIERVYRRYERAHGPGDQNATLDFGTRIGPVALYMMDLRSERGVDPKSPIVGDTQHRRLAEWITDLDKNVRLLVVVTSVPITFVNASTIKTGMQDHKDLDLDLADQWNYPGRDNIFFDNRPDLSRLLKTLFAWQAPKRQVIVIGGDVHMSYGHKLRSGDKEILSFATSPLSNHPIEDFHREVLEAGILYKDHKLVEGVRGGRISDDVIFDPNFGELVFDALKGTYSFSVITPAKTTSLYRGTL